MNFDPKLTSKVYDDFVLDDYSLKVWRKFKDLNDGYIKDLSLIDLPATGIDFDKPWECIKMKEFMQIEYIFAGTIDVSQFYIEHQIYGINIYPEFRFGKKEFGTKNVLCLTVISENA